jgi:hypothetical protein
MAHADRELVAAIRAELASIDPTRPCDRAAESQALGTRPTTSEPAVARLAVRLGLATPPVTRRRASAATGLSRVADGGRDPSAEGPERIPAGQDEAHGSRVAATPPAGDTSHFDWEARPDHCRMAYLRGLFLARGSLSIAGPRTHLEFSVAPHEAALLARRLGDAGLPASWRIRRGRGVVTWKSAETVALFLRRAGLRASLLEFEARRVQRAVRSDLNRVVNAESANLERAVAAAGRQLEAIDTLEADGRLSGQPYTVRMVADGRRETPEATLSELAERLGIGRSVVQRALERIEWLALHGDAPARRGGPAPARRQPPLA